MRSRIESSFEKRIFFWRVYEGRDCIDNEGVRIQRFLTVPTRRERERERERIPPKR